MNCSCAVDVYTDDYEPVGLLKITTRRAIKAHKCKECYRQILPGEEYENASYLFDGAFYEDKICSDCLSAVEQFFPLGGYCDLWLDISEEIDNSHGEIPENCITELTPAARGKICDILDEYFVWSERNSGLML